MLYQWPIYTLFCKSFATIFVVSSVIFFCSFYWNDKIFAKQNVFLNKSFYIQNKHINTILFQENIYIYIYVGIQHVFFSYLRSLSKWKKSKTFLFDVLTYAILLQLTKILNHYISSKLWYTKLLNSIYYSISTSIYAWHYK